jgi:hypothetical protein
MAVRPGREGLSVEGFFHAAAVFKSVGNATVAKGFVRF